MRLYRNRCEDVTNLSDTLLIVVQVYEFQEQEKVTSKIVFKIPRRHEMSLRDLNQISIETDISEASQKHLKRDDIFVTSLRPFKYISKKIPYLFCDVFKMSRAYLKKDIFSVTYLRRLKNISCGTARNTKEMKRFLGAVHTQPA